MSTAQMTVTPIWSPFGPTTERDWTEDAKHENGSYQCTCVECCQRFVGYKRRMLCRVCTGAASREQDARDKPVETMEYRT